MSCQKLIQLGTTKCINTGFFALWHLASPLKKITRQKLQNRDTPPSILKISAPAEEHS